MKKLDIIILCGGLGKRIRSKSKNLPKILIEIEKNVPFIKYLFYSLKIKQFRNIILSIGYRGNKIISFSKKNPKLKLILNVEKNLLGTGGAIKDVIKKRNLTNPFIVSNGDTFHPFDFKKVLNEKVLNTKKSHILLKNSEKGRRFDQFKIYKKKLIMLHKKQKGLNFINSGIYLFYKKDFDISKNKFSIEEDIRPKLIKNNKLNHIKNKSNIFFDIGIPKDLNKFKRYIHNKKLKIE